MEKAVQESGAVVKPVAKDLASLQQKLLSGELKTPDFPIGPPIPGRSPEIFIGREDEIMKTLEALTSGQDVWMYGEQRSGKSSMLNRLQSILETQYEGVGVLRLDLQGDVPMINGIVGEKPKNGLIEKIKDRFAKKNNLKEKQDNAMLKIVSKRRDRENLGADTRIICLVDEVTNTNTQYIENLPGILQLAFPNAQQINFVLAGFLTLEEHQRLYKIASGNTNPSWFPKTEIEIKPAIPRDVREKLGIPW